MQQDGLPECSFEVFYLRYYDFVFRIALRITHCSDDADDVAQTVFARLLARPGGFRGGNFDSWLTTVTKNAAVSLLRRRTRELVLFRSNEHEYFTSETESRAIANVEAMRLRRAISKLSENSRTLIVDAFITGRTHTVIAKDYAVPLGTIKTRIRTGITRLRHLLDAP